MTLPRPSWLLVIVVAITCALAGAGVVYRALARLTGPRPSPSAASGAAPVNQSTPTDGALPDVRFSLSQEAIRRAGVATVPVSEIATHGSVRVVGVIEPNGYRQVSVAPLVSGRVSRVFVELGERVAANAALVEIFSPELAEAQTRFLTMLAEFQAFEQQIVRTERLVAIGAASTQELERAHAEHVGHRTEVASARSRLELLGMTDQQVEALTSGGLVAATMTIRSPTSGVVTTRSVNSGSTVDSATPLVTVVDLSTVWVVGDLYERDFASVKLGTDAIVTTSAFPDLMIKGRIAYMEPQVRSETRTAKVRIEVPNANQQLRLGMYADVLIQNASATTQLAVPRSAVQNVSNRTVVYLKDPSEEGQFVEREVRVSPTADNRSVVLSGLTAGDVVVSEGSFFLRAERERLGLRPER